MSFVVNEYKKRAFQKLGFSFAVVMIYILGSNLVIPGVDSQNLRYLINISPSSSLALSMTGASFSKISLFSLGLGPWMSSLIFWRVLSVAKILNVQKLTNEQAYRIKFILSIMLGFFQSLAVLSQVRILQGGARVVPWMLVVILIAGFSILVWLGNLNIQLGIGGPTLIILVSIMKEWPSQLEKFTSIIVKDSILFTILNCLLFLSIVLILSYFICRFYQGERRLKIMHVMLDGNSLNQSYLPIPTNPASGVPFMYAFSVTLIPQYLLFSIKGKSIFLEELYKQMQLDHIAGVLVFTLSLVLLTYGFSYVNIDYRDISSHLKKSGDYFVNVYPGKNTENYLFNHITRMATVAVVVNNIIISVPMFLAIQYSSLSLWVYFIPTWLIFLILINEIYIQFSKVYHRGDYRIPIK